MDHTLTIAPGDVRRKAEQTALDDHDVELVPGTYTVRHLTVDGRESEPEKAYWVCATIPCIRVHDGARWGKAGDREIYHYQTWRK